MRGHEDELRLGDHDLDRTGNGLAVRTDEEHCSGREHLASTEPPEHLGAARPGLLGLGDGPTLGAKLGPVEVHQDVGQDRRVLGPEEAASDLACTADEVVRAHGYFDADSADPTAACPAASRAVSTRYGEQLT